MKLEVNKDKITRAINKAEKIATKNSTLPAISCLLFDFDGSNLKIKATNLDISLTLSLKVKGNEKNKILVPANILSSFLSNLPKNDSNIILETEGTKLHVTSDSTDTVINTQITDDFPIVSEEKAGTKFEINSNDLIKGLNSVWYSTATSSIKPELSSVYIYSDDNDLVFVGTDSFRLAENRIKVRNSENFENILIPYKNVVEIIRVLEDVDQDISIYFDQDKINIDAGDITIISRVVDGVFPDYKQIIPKEVKTEINVLKEDLYQSLKVSNVFTDKFNQVIFSIFPTDNIFQITSNTNDVGESKNKIRSKLSGDNLKISFNSKYVTDSFNSIKSDSITLKFNGTDKPMIIQGGSDKSFLYLVMPMNK